MTSLFGKFELSFRNKITVLLIYNHLVLRSIRWEPSLYRSWG